jgi:hypothetical protein
MKIPRSVTNLLENKYVLYIVFFLAVSNVLGYIMTGKTKSVIAFILIAYLVSLFSKNMIIILAVPLLVISFLMAGNHIREGLTNNDKKEPEKEKGEKEKGEEKEESNKKAPDKKVAPPKKIDHEIIDGSDVIEPDDSTPEGSEDLDNTPKSGMTTMYKKNNRIDYASTVENAYDDLNKILGGDGIKRLTGDTQKLMGQQMQLAEAMKSMTPLLGQAKELLKGFDLKNLGDITSMAKSFGVSK